MKKLNALKKFVLVFFIFNYITTLAQNKKLEIEEIVADHSFYPKSLTQIQFIPHSTLYSFISNEKLVIGDLLSTKKDTILSKKDFLQSHKSAYNNSESFLVFPTLEWVSDKKFNYRIDNTFYQFDIEKRTTKEIVSLDKEAANIEIAFNQTSIAYTIKNNLYIWNNNKHHTITEYKDEGIVSGQFVHRNEFGITKGIFWSPKSAKIAFYKMDETMVTKYPIVDIHINPASVNPIRYPMAGMKSHEVMVGIYNLSSEKIIYLQTGEPKDQYLTNIVWSNDEKYIFIVVLNRDQNHLQLNQYNAETGAYIKTIFEEKDEKYVHPKNPILFLKNNSEQFIWQSRRDGYNHLYLYDLKQNKLIKQLTKGEWEVTSVLGFDQKGENVLIEGTKKTPLENHIYKINIKNTSITAITEEDGYHHGILSPDGNYIVDTYSSISIPKNIEIHNTTNGKITDRLFSASNPLKDYKKSTIKMITVKAKDQTTLYGRLILPPSFDEKKKYPTLVYTYAGPNVQIVKNEWLGDKSSNLWLLYMSQQGYIIFSLDNRGSDNRGKNFEQITFQHLGKYEMEDQLQGVEYLKSLSFVDTNRLGVFGWSFGGFMATTLMVKSPNTFKVGVAGAPVIDWSYYEIMYGERYMDTPEKNPEGYKESSTLNYVENLKGKFLLIHGTSDNVVVWQHTLLFIDKCIEKDRAVDYFVYPGDLHHIKELRNIHLFKKITSYFKENL